MSVRRRRSRRQQGASPAGGAGAPTGEGAIPAAGLQPLVSLLGERQRLVITSHFNPDGDAVGSCLALARGLSRLGKSARITLGDLPGRYRFLDPEGVIEVCSAAPSPEAFRDRDLGVVLDATEPDRLGVLREGFFDAPFDRLSIDHHLSGPRAEYVLQYTNPAAAATGSIILRLLDELGVSVDRSIAEALFVAIATDTGWFRYSNTSAEVLEDAARLLEAGVEPEPLHRRVYEQLPLPRVRLQGTVIGRIRSDFSGGFVWSYLERETIRQAGVSRPDFEGLIDPLRTVDGAGVVALLIETDPGTWKVSFRSSGEWDVQRIARRLGGGGHRKAAGCQVEGTLEEVEARLKQEVERELAEEGTDS